MVLCTQVKMYVGISKSINKRKSGMRKLAMRARGSENCACSSVGIELDRQTEGRGFDSHCSHT